MNVETLAMITGTSAHTHTFGTTNDAEYNEFLQRVNARFIENTKGRPVFLTTAQRLLWSTYLAAFPPELRQHHNCNACRHFIERFGSLVTIDNAGHITSALWDDRDPHAPYGDAVRAMRMLVERAGVTGVFLSDEKVWGQPKTGDWQHLFVHNPAPFKHALRSPYQAMAEKAQDYITVGRALQEYTPNHLNTAIALLESETLYRSEKVIGPAKWLRDLHASQIGTTGPRRAHVLWRAVATAPEGFCHPRSSMIGTLLDDIAAGKSFADVSRAFAAKMKPTVYQRPQAAPTAGNIAAAERAFAAMGLERSLERRYARIEELVAAWLPTTPRGAVGGGLFGHLAPKGEPLASMTISGQTMTYEKFVRTVLPGALSIQLRVPSNGSFAGLVTAVHDDAPPIIQWDRQEQRNPVSWYVYPLGSRAEHWGLVGGRYVKVTAITLKPSMWHGGNEHQGKGVVFVLDGARDTRNPSACLFPEILRSELHAYRATIEAYSRKASLSGAAEASANGLMLNAGQPWTPVTLSVTTAAGIRDIALDRWD